MFSTVHIHMQPMSSPNAYGIVVPDGICVLGLAYSADVDTLMNFR